MRAEGICPLPNKSAVPPSSRWFGWGMDMGGCRRRCRQCPFPGNIPLQSTNPLRAMGRRRGTQHKWVWPHLGGSRRVPWKFLPLPAPCSGRMRSEHNPPTSLKRCWNPLYTMALQGFPEKCHAASFHCVLDEQGALSTQATPGKPSWCPVQSICKAAC